jgi:hypothetical protein
MDDGRFIVLARYTSTPPELAFVLADLQSSVREINQHHNEPCCDDELKRYFQATAWVIGQS